MGCCRRRREDGWEHQVCVSLAVRRSYSWGRWGLSCLIILRVIFPPSLEFQEDVVELVLDRCCGVFLQIAIWCRSQMIEHGNGIFKEQDDGGDALVGGEESKIICLDFKDLGVALALCLGFKLSKCRQQRNCHL